MSKVEGVIILDIVKEREFLMDEFKESYINVINEYINPTPINHMDIEFLKNKNDIVVLYSFEDDVKFHYESIDSSGTSTKNSSEVGRSLYELWAKWTVEAFFSDELKVQTRYVAIKYFSIRGWKVI